MDSPLSTSHYISDEIHRKEQSRLFRKLWIFAGLKQLVSKPNAFITRSIGGIPVVIQNMNGTLKAFENVCPHRQMSLQSDAVGHRPLVCKYHAWAFDENGKLRAKGNEFLYELTEEETSRACLRQFVLAEVGNMLFVNLDETPMPLEEQFTNEFLDSMREVSGHFDDEVIYTVFEKKHNWKLTFENVLDYNHIPFIHTQSFLPLIELNVNASKEDRVIPQASRDLKQRLYDGQKIDLRDLSFETGSTLNIPTTWYQAEVHRYRDEPRYYNWYTYPNVNFCSVHGNMFLIQQYMPVSPGVMEYHLWVMTARRKNPKINFSALLWGLIKAEKKVIDEDAVALEQLQRTLHDGARPYLMGTYEAHIVRMLRWYADFMSDDKTTASKVKARA
jgi:phenylpropionate dioxygenase-like ring-hydroxylating dioxygenase large terminal subunit